MKNAGTLGLKSNMISRNLDRINRNVNSKPRNRRGKHKNKDNNKRKYKKTYLDYRKISRKITIHKLLLPQQNLGL